MENKNLLILKAIKKYYKEDDFKKINQLVSDIHPNLFYDYFIKQGEWKEEDYIVFLENLKIEYAAKLFANFQTNYQLELISILSDKTLKKIFSEFYIDEAVDLLEEYPYEKARYIINLLDEDQAKKITDIFKYKKYQIGFHMVLDFVAISDKLTIHEAKNDIKKKVNKKSLEIIGNIFVVDKENKLIGYITPDRIIVEENDKKIIDFLMPIDFIHPTDKISKAEKILSKFDVPSVPVVDKDQKIVGVIEAEDIIEMYDEIDNAFFEAPKEKYAGKSYFDFSVIDLFKSRIVWLLILLIVGVLSQIVIMEFQGVWEKNGIYGSSSEAAAVIVSQIITLALFTSLSVSSSINDSAGNSGSQTSATIIRAIATGEIEQKDFGKAIWKETKVAFYLGLVISIVSFIRVFFVWWIVGSLRDIPEAATELGWSEGKVWLWYCIIALISSVTFFLAILIGNLIGAVLPIIAYKFNSDGTIIAGPLQTTVVDLFVVTLYLGLTTAIFVPLSQNGYFDVTETLQSYNFEATSNLNQFFFYQI
ncbi:/ / Magnesium transporter mgtE / 40366:41967 Forward [Candidatus Hepatoplasma crinochetorum]|uniref:/ / Magnesium transporter mgtE / 40366:41967 Forward n=1 Tax=Candidatus Hepatoplasma crinochetorum TaxID=295596 RepID=A0A0G7ZN93_9MOLU|nr:/ / Magnesium transporter mgtE / 40366:41967 Forward [Candidatus Hepatoplasma crinochetorum]